MNNNVIVENCCRCEKELEWMMSFGAGGWAWEPYSEDWCHPEVVMDVFMDCAPIMLRVWNERPGAR